MRGQSKRDDKNSYQKWANSPSADEGPKHWAEPKCVRLAMDSWIGFESIQGGHTWIRIGVNLVCQNRSWFSKKWIYSQSLFWKWILILIYLLFHCFETSFNKTNASEFIFCFQFVNECDWKLEKHVKPIPIRFINCLAKLTYCNV